MSAGGKRRGEITPLLAKLRPNVALLVLMVQDVYI